MMACGLANGRLIPPEELKNRKEANRMRKDRPDEINISCQCGWSGSALELMREVEFFAPTIPPTFRCPECQKIFVVEYLGIIPGTEIIQIFESSPI